MTGLVSTSFLDPKEKSLTEMTTGSVISIIILLGLFLCGLVGQILTIFTKKKAINGLKSGQINSDLSTKIQNTVPLLSSADFENPQPRRESGKIEKFFKCFSWSENLEKLFSTKEGMDTNLDVFNGIRFFSMCYVIIGHEYIVRMGSSMNISDIPDILKETGWTDIISAATYSVDVFFFMGGFFVAFVMLGKLSNPKIKFNLKFVLSSYFHRFYRIWPSYAIAILIYWKISIYFGDGPLWSFYKGSVNPCETRWWKNLLFIDNLFNDDATNYCFAWGWYLSNDFQMFLMTPFLIYLYTRNKFIGLFSITLFIVGCMMGALGVSIAYDLAPSLTGVTFPDSVNSYLFFPKYYSKPWVRGDVYYFGLLVGIVYKEMKDGLFPKIREKLINSIFFKLPFYLVGLFLINFLIFCVDPLKEGKTEWNRVEQLLYLVFFRIGFIVGLYLVIFPALVTGNDIVGKILGFKFFTPVARLTFTMYLMHLIIITRSSTNSRQIGYFNNENVIYFTLADILLTFLAGLGITLLIESPLLNIEKEFILKERKKQSTLVPNKELND
jgi:hypothetical protein